MQKQQTDNSYLGPGGVNTSRARARGIGAALSTMDDAAGGDGGDGGGDGGMEGGFAIDPNQSVDGMLNSMTHESPDEHCYFQFLRFI